MTNRPSMMCIYDAEWQNIRVALLGKWNDDLIVSCLATCHEYVDEGRGNVYSRTFRVINCMNATVMGWNGTNSVSVATRSMLDAARKSIRNIHSTAEQHGETFVWEWDYHNLYTKDLLPIHNDLLKRWKAHPNMKWRPELFMALQSIGGVLKVRGVEFEEARPNG